MNFGSIAGTIVGGVGGFMVGGPAGAMAGASLGGQLGAALDPQEQPKINGQAYASQVDPEIERKIKNNILNGRDPAAEAFARNQMSRNVAAANSVAASARGTNSGTAQRLATQAATNSNAQIASQANQIAQNSVNNQLGEYLGLKSADRNAAIAAAQAKYAQDLAQQQREDKLWGNLMGGLSSAGALMGTSAVQTPATSGTGTTGYLGVDTNLTGAPAPASNPYSLGVDYNFAQYYK